MRTSILKEWQHTIRTFAKKNGYVDNPWLLRHYFYDVFTYAHDENGNLDFDYEGYPKIKKGKDSNRSIAFKPQSSAAMFMRDNLYIMGQSVWAQYMPAVVSIHDGYTLDVPVALAEDAAHYLEALLTRPIDELGGLCVGCEIEMSASFEDGGHFLDMTSVKLCEV